MEEHPPCSHIQYITNGNTKVQERPAPRRRRPLKKTQNRSTRIEQEVHPPKKLIGYAHPYAVPARYDTCTCARHTIGDQAYGSPAPPPSTPTRDLMNVIQETNQHMDLQVTLDLRA